MVNPVQELVVCGTFESRFEADAARGQLLANDIEAEVLGNPVPVVVPHVGGSPGFKVVVDPSDLDAATELLAATPPADPAVYTRFRDRSLGIRLTGWALFLALVVPILVVYSVQVIQVALGTFG